MGLGSMVPAAPITLNHSQVTGNTAAHGGGIFKLRRNDHPEGYVLLPATTPTTANPQAASPAASAKENLFLGKPFRRASDSKQVPRAPREA